VTVFDLERHQFLSIHASELEPWVFDETIGGKLVLPEMVMACLGALVKGSASLMEDIIKGKTGGTFILCDGKPGLGKTLSAEVFAEIMHKPLYKVQCSQLGLNPEELEEELGKVLARAARWGCVLLIDEGDVYVRARGDDLVQNAIVGVWLRVLEYFRGVLFMTTNKGDDIDDAIRDRATAIIRYRSPDHDELARIWTVLLAQYEMETPTDEIPALVKEWPNANGRSVKNLIRLARSLLASGIKLPWLSLYRMAGQFVDVPKSSNVTASKS
jgi:SpoVK/Ycf46/Vps4 family AAA+-type ATPase